MTTNEKILTIVREKGPILPVHVSKEINDTILMTSARLSELLSNKLIKISNVKVGGSPLYYMSGQENKLQDYSDHLVQKEKEAYELLRENKILRDSTQEPAIRVALRQIKDFAFPLQVNYENKIEIFWKWYLTEKEESNSIIKKLLLKKEEITKEKSIEENKDIKEKSLQTEGIIKTPTQKQETTKPQETEEGEIKKEKKKVDKDFFLRITNNFFSKNKINIIETNEIKKNTEIDLIVELQTSIGNVRYFCKSKNKKKINEGDLSSAMIQAQSKGLPLMFITRGKIAKKAKELFNTDFKNIVYREI